MLNAFVALHGGTFKRDRVGEAQRFSTGNIINRKRLKQAGKREGRAFERSGPAVSVRQLLQ
jgi:hypothetical protein